MATYIPVVNIPTQFFDNSGDPLDGGTLEFYEAGTSTATDLYSDDSGTSIGTSIGLNSWGYPESGGNTIHLFRDQSVALKIVAKNSSGATIWTADDIPAVASFDSTSSEKLGYITVTQAVNLDTMESGIADNVTDIAACLQADGSVEMTGDLPFGDGTYEKGGATDGIIASVVQTQAGATALTNRINEVATVASTNDAVVLPAAVGGRSVIVINNGANTLQVFPASGDAINGGAVDASTTIASGNNINFVAYNNTTWEAS